MEENQKLDRNSEKVMVYAIGSGLEAKQDEPLFLVIDDAFPNGQFLLYYLPDDGGDEADEGPSKGTPLAKVKSRTV